MASPRWRVMDVPASAASPPLNLGVDLPTLLSLLKREEEEIDLDFALH